MKQSLSPSPDADPVCQPAQASAMVCRPLCGACCTAPSISTPIPQPDGGPPRPKAAGEPCPQLDEALRCRLFGHTSRPSVCASLRPDAEMCGTTRTHAMQHLLWLETATAATVPRAV